MVHSLAKFSVTGQKVLVIGLGISGRSAAQLLLKKGAEVVGTDRNQELLEKNSDIATLRSQGLKTILEGSTVNIEEFSLVVVSPGVPQTHPLYVKAKQAKIEVIGEVELACRFLIQKCVGITGTNGKTTVTLLVSHVLNHAQKPAKALGNVGIPLAAQIASEEDLGEQILVIELSSYQLETLHAPVLDAAVILNITPDHLDRYSSMQEYAKAKFLIQNCLKPTACLYLEESVKNDFGVLAQHPNVTTYGYAVTNDFVIESSALRQKEQILLTFPSHLQGKRSHDAENATAAYLLCRQFGVTAKQFLEAFATFKKPPHRVEFVACIKGVSYYDDSKGTNIDAVIKAVRSLPGKIVLIAGGVDKGASYAPWIAAFEERVSRICVIGQAAEKIQRELSPAISVETYKNLHEAVVGAAQKARPGDSVLLSPGCSSYDMFRDYKHRGEEFQRLVSNLKGEQNEDKS